jgi:DNA-binding CsgD family transcriptional regulator
MEVSKKLGISVDQVRRLEERAFRKLKANKDFALLEEYLKCEDKRVDSSIYNCSEEL